MCAWQEPPNVREVRVQRDQKPTFLADMRPEDIVACTSQLLIMNVCHVVACSFQDAAMSP